MAIGEDLVMSEAGSGAGGEEAPKVARRGRVVTAVLGWTKRVGADWSRSRCDDRSVVSSCLLSRLAESRSSVSSTKLTGVDGCCCCSS